MTGRAWISSHTFQQLVTVVFGCQVEQSANSAKIDIYNPKLNKVVNVDNTGFLPPAAMLDIIDRLGLHNELRRFIEKMEHDSKDSDSNS